MTHYTVPVPYFITRWSHATPSLAPPVNSDLVSATYYARLKDVSAYLPLPDFSCTSDIQAVFFSRDPKQKRLSRHRSLPIRCSSQAAYSVILPCVCVCAHTCDHAAHMYHNFHSKARIKILSGQIRPNLHVRLKIMSTSAPKSTLNYSHQQ